MRRVPFVGLRRRPGRPAGETRQFPEKMTVLRRPVQRIDYHRKMASDAALGGRHLLWIGGAAVVGFAASVTVTEVVRAAGAGVSRQLLRDRHRLSPSTCNRPASPCPRLFVRAGRARSSLASSGASSSSGACWRSLRPLTRSAWWTFCGAASFTASSTAPCCRHFRGLSRGVRSAASRHHS